MVPGSYSVTLERFYSLTQHENSIGEEIRSFVISSVRDDAFPKHKKYHFYCSRSIVEVTNVPCGSGVIYTAKQSLMCKMWMRNY